MSDLFNNHPKRRPFLRSFCLLYGVNVHLSPIQLTPLPRPQNGGFFPLLALILTAHLLQIDDVPPFVMALQVLPDFGLLSSMDSVREIDLSR